MQVRQRRCVASWIFGFWFCWTCTHGCLAPQSLVEIPFDMEKVCSVQYQYSKGCICARILKILPWLILIVFDFTRKRGNCLPPWTATTRKHQKTKLAWFEGLAVLHTSRYFHEPERVPSGVVLVAVRFLAAQSIVDVSMEVIQFYGYAAIGQPRDYLQLENFLDLLWAVIPSYLWFNPQYLGEFCNTSLWFLQNMFEVCRTSINWYFVFLFEGLHALA